MNSPLEVAPGFAVSAQPDARDIASFAALGYRTVINNRPDGEEAVQMTAVSARVEAERLGLAYIHIPVTIGTISAADVVAFDKAIQESPSPIVAHCRSGMRSYLLWAAAQALDGRADPAELAAEAVGKGYDLKSLSDLVARLRQRDQLERRDNLALPRSWPVARERRVVDKIGERTNTPSEK